MKTKKRAKKKSKGKASKVGNPTAGTPVPITVRTEVIAALELAFHEASDECSATEVERGIAAAEVAFHAVHAIGGSIESFCVYLRTQWPAFVAHVREVDRQRLDDHAQQVHR